MRGSPRALSGRRCWLISGHPYGGFSQPLLSGSGARDVPSAPGHFTIKEGMTMTRRAVWFGIAVVLVSSLGVGLALAKDADPSRHHPRQSPDDRVKITVYVKVLDFSGNPVQGHVILYPAGNHNTPGFEGNTGADGIGLMQLSPIDTGLYDIEVVGYNGLKCNVSITRPYFRSSPLPLKLPF